VRGGIVCATAKVAPGRKKERLGEGKGLMGWLLGLSSKKATATGSTIDMEIEDDIGKYV